MKHSITIDRLSLTYEGCDTPALHEIDLALAWPEDAGGCLVISGPSGSGKSTLIKLINGLIPTLYPGTATGSLSFDGIDLLKREPHEIARHVGSVHQDARAQFFNLRVIDELFFGLENMDWPRERMLNRVLELSEQLDLERLWKRSLLDISGGERQRLSLGCALSFAPKILLLDEPSANLDSAGVERLRRMIEEYKAQGYLIVVAEHRLYYLRDLMDYLLVLKEGTAEALLTRTEALDYHNPNLRSFEQYLPLSVRQKDTTPARAEKPGRLEFVGLNFLDVIRNARLELEPGKVNLLCGPNGAGKTTLARLISGYYKHDKERRRALKNGEVFYVLQDSDYELLTESVTSEIALSFPDLSSDEIAAHLDALDLEACADRIPLTLSGGQKQRLLLLIASLSKAPLLILDEPTSGLDRQNMLRAASLISSMTREGQTVLLITHDFELISLVGEQFLWLEDGAVAENFELSPQTENRMVALFERIRKAV